MFYILYYLDNADELLTTMAYINLPVKTCVSPEYSMFRSGKLLLSLCMQLLKIYLLNKSKALKVLKTSQNFILVKLQNCNYY